MLACLSDSNHHPFSLFFFLLLPFIPSSHFPSILPIAASWLPSRPRWAEQIGSIITYNNCSGQVTLSWHRPAPWWHLPYANGIVGRWGESVASRVAGARADCRPVLALGLPCQQICDTLAANKHRHSGPDGRRREGVKEELKSLFKWWFFLFFFYNSARYAGIRKHRH